MTFAGNVIAALVATDLAVFAGAHVTLLGSLALRAPRYRAIVALVVPPLAPYWAWRDGLKVRVYVWAATLTVYGIGVAVLVR
jgi:hypothetical protein